MRTTISKRKLAIVAAALAVLAGGSTAAVAALGHGKGRHDRGHLRAGARGLSQRDLRAVAAYLGVSSEALVGQLQSGKTLAQIANATPGRSAAGLEAVLLAEKRERLATVAAGLTRRVDAEVNHSHTAAKLKGASHSRSEAGVAQVPRPRLLMLAAQYLGLPATSLQAQLQGGRSLGEVAAATPGKSSQGLVSALLAARKEKLATSVAQQKMSQARAEHVSARQLKRIETLVDRRAGGA